MLYWIGLGWILYVTSVTLGTLLTLYVTTKERPVDGDHFRVILIGNVALAGLLGAIMFFVSPFISLTRRHNWMELERMRDGRPVRWGDRTIVRQDFFHPLVNYLN